MTSPKVLIIDDNPSDRILALRELKKLFPQLQSWEIIDEISFAKALQANNFNLVITDYQLRWTTGLNILDRIKEKRPDCPIIMFTGTGSEEIAVAAMKAGLDDYVIKSPKHYVRLAAAVRSAWQRSQQQKALEELKQRYDRLFERVPIGLYRLNTSGEIKDANSTLIQMLGYEREQNLPVRNLAEYHVDIDSFRQWQRQLQDLEVVKEFEGQIRHPDGELIWVRHNAIAVKDRQDRIVYYEGAVENITASKQAELERVELLARERQARQEAETANRVKDEFLATLSHELRTPLNSILGWVQILRSGYTGEEQSSKALEVIERNAKAQNQLIDDLLDVSRIIRGTMTLQLQPIELSQIVKAAIDTVRPGAEAKNIQIYAPSDTRTIEVNGDPERLQQVFWNLLINAVKFTPANGEIDVSLETQLDTVLVKVKDTGQGMAADVLPFVFDRFRQAETKSSTRTKGGLGLGLAIVRHLVEIQGGTVKAESEGIGQGSTFTVKLPLVDLANITQQKSSESLPLSSLPSLANLNLLLVEDEADAREMVTAILSQCGANVIAVDSVKQALIECQRKCPDLLISDISLPFEDGYALIRQLRSYPDARGELRAIALTAYAREEDKQRAKDAGFDFHLPKPIEPFQLINAIARLLGNA